MISELPPADWQAVQVSDGARTIWQLKQSPARMEWAELDCQQRLIQVNLWLCLQPDVLWIYQRSWQQHWLTRLPLSASPLESRYWLGNALLIEHSEHMQLQLFQSQWSAQQILAQVEFRYQQRLVGLPRMGHQQVSIELKVPSEYWFIQEQATGSTIIRVTYAE
ncbi:MAG TPA: hypothetical protein VFM61_05640 [Pseudidiomarina sp.]|nr:hypothetical protein [Pseudidiomarina sp.]